MNSYKRTNFHKNGNRLQILMMINMLTRKRCGNDMIDTNVEKSNRLRIQNRLKLTFPHSLGKLAWDVPGVLLLILAYSFMRVLIADTVFHNHFENSPSFQHFHNADDDEI